VRARICRDRVAGLIARNAASIAMTEGIRLGFDPRHSCAFAHRQTHQHGVTDDHQALLIDTPLGGGFQMRQRIELRGGFGESARSIDMVRVPFLALNTAPKGDLMWG
jgi:hypothetical protein